MIKIIKLERKSLEQFLDENNLTIEVIEDKSGQFRAKFIDFFSSRTCAIYTSV